MLLISPVAVGLGLSVCRVSTRKRNVHCYVAAKATYIRLLHGKIGFLGFFGPNAVKRGRTHIVLG